MIELKDGRYYKAFLVFEFKAGQSIMGVPTPHMDGNLLAAIYTDDPERKKWDLLYRFRYYVDDKLGQDSDDQRAWYRMTAESDEVTLFEQTRWAFEQMAEAAKSELTVGLIESDKSDVQLEKIGRMPGMHMGPAEPMKPDYSLN